MFRYDRPQAGRFRQFWQWDVEAIGDAGPAVDAELIELGARFYRDAGLADVEVHLNSIGDPDVPAGLPRACCGRTTRRTRPALPPAERRGSRRTRCGCSTRRTRHGGAQRQRAAHHRPPVRRVRRALRRRAGPSRRGRDRVPDRAHARARPRLLHADRVRVLPPRRRRPAVGPGRRRPLRRAGRAAGRHARRRASASRWASTASCWPSAEQGRRGSRRRRPARRRRGRRSGGHERAPAGRDRRSGRPAWRSAPTSARASSAGSSRAPHATVPTSPSSSATSWPTAHVQLRDLQAGTQRSATSPTSSASWPRSQAGHRHG